MESPPTQTRTGSDLLATHTLGGGAAWASAVGVVCAVVLSPPLWPGAAAAPRAGR